MKVNLTILLILFISCGNPDRYFVASSSVSQVEKLVVFIDGTGKGTGDNSDIHRMFSALDSTQSIKGFYTEGLGTGMRLFGVPFGSGIRKDIRDGYAFISEHYNPSVGIYLFGYSRGAFSVRSLASMIAVCGIIDFHKIKDDGRRKKFLRELYTSYHGKGGLASRRQDVKNYVEEWNRKYGDGLKVANGVRIDGMGLYDSVEALGVQDREESTCCPNKYHLTSLCMVDKAYQVLSLDDNRANVFTPLFLNCACSFDECQEASRLGDADFEEVWFGGSHRDVASGSLNSGHSINWMLSKFALDSLFIDITYHSSITAPLHDAEGSISGLFYKRKNRSIDVFLEQSPTRKIKVHASAIERIRLGVEGYDSEWYKREAFAPCFEFNGKGYDLLSSCKEILVIDN